MNVYYKVAGLPFRVSLPDGWNADALLPSLCYFRCGKCGREALIFNLDIVAEELQPIENLEFLSESQNDMGRLCLFRKEGGYYIEIGYGEGPRHKLISDSTFRNAKAYIYSEDSSLKLVLSSILRIIFAQSVILNSGVSIHASCVVLHGLSYLFLGKSGTGKSTHAQQWLEAFSECMLLNDDNPVVRMEGEKVIAYGTPWSGKTPCYIDAGYPVGGIVRLKQAAENKFRRLEEPENFTALLPSCSSIRQDEMLQDALCDTLIEIAENVSVGSMECLPEREAAVVCLNGLKN
ncbi:MAG: phosphoenolpyruvate carboxykinase [Bacteroidales bacterium]|nr:phosphoenolpyruvate carboxykinase [Bacteroidales bacterium]